MNRIIVISSLICFSICSFGQSTVYVESKEMGRGILRQRNSECLIITPYHVVEDATSTINIYGENSTKSTAEFVQSAPYDLAIMRLKEGSSIPCANWTLPKNYDQILNRNNSAFLELREKTGTVRLIDVKVMEKDAEYISISPVNGNLLIVKGWSGSALYCNDGMNKVYLGMLSDVDVDNNIGQVLRTDVMMLTLSTFFNSAKLNQIKKSSGNSGLAYQENNNVKCVVTDYSQNQGILTVNFTLTNTNSSLSKLDFSNTYWYNSIIDQDGNLYNGKSIKLGNSVNRIDLVYNIPVRGEITFDVGANQISKIEKIEIDGSSGDFTMLNIDKNVSSFDVVSDGESFNTSSSIDEIDKDKVLATAINKGIKCDINNFYQNGTKATLFFTLTNMSSGQSIRDESNTYWYNQILDQNGLQFNGTAIYLGNSNNRAKLIYNVPLKCKAEFEVGVNKITTLAYIKIDLASGYFEFFKIPLVNDDQSNIKSLKLKNSNESGSILSVPSKDILLGDLTEGDVNMKISKIEQIGNKVILDFFITSVNSSNNVLSFSTTSYQSEIKDRTNNSYKCDYIQIGSTEGRTTLVYNTPVPCSAEFNVGPNAIKDVSYIKLSTSTGDFEFIGKKGKMGQAGSLKSKKADETKKALLITGGILLLDAAADKIKKNEEKKKQQKP